MTERGLVEMVDTIDDGDFLTSDLTAGDTVWPVDNTDIFETESLTGSVQLNGVEYGYTAVDPDASTITVSTGLAADATVNDKVFVFPLTPVKMADVKVGDGEGDSYPARVPFGLASYTALKNGPREPGTEETVIIEEDDHGWVVAEVIGSEPLFDAASLDPNTTPPDAIFDDTQFMADFIAAQSAIAAADDEIALRVRLYRQDTEPTDKGPNTVWIDTDDGNKMYVGNGVTYLSAQDAAIAAAQSDADDAAADAATRAKVFRQAAMPTDVSAGNVWFNTSNGNKPYVADGTTYVLSPDTTIVGSQLVATAIDGMTITGSIFQTSANAGDGTHAGVRWSTSGIRGYNSASGTPTFTLDATTGILTAIGAQVTGQLNATSGTITLLQVTGALYAGVSPTAQRVEVTPSGVVGYDSTNTPKTLISAADGSLSATSATISGTITATGGTISGTLLVSGTLRTAASGARVEMSSAAGFALYTTSQLMLSITDLTSTVGGGGTLGSAVHPTSGDVYVLGAANVVRRYTAAGIEVLTGGFPRTISGAPTVVDIAIDQSGNFFITTTAAGGQLVRKWSSTWVEQTTGGFPITLPASTIYQIATDSGGAIYVSGRLTAGAVERIWKYTTAGVQVTTGGFPISPSGVGGQGSGLCVNQSTGMIYATDVVNGVIQRYSSAGAPSTDIVVAGGISHLFGICNDSAGSMYVTDGFYMRKFASTGIEASTSAFPNPQSGMGAIAAIEISPDGGTLYAMGAGVLYRWNNPTHEAVSASMSPATGLLSVIGMRNSGTLTTDYLAASKVFGTGHGGRLDISMPGLFLVDAGDLIELDTQSSFTVSAGTGAVIDGGVGGTNLYSGSAGSPQQVRVAMGASLNVFTGGDLSQSAFNVASTGFITIAKHDTTTTAANVNLTTGGALRRVTSSRRFKYDITEIDERLPALAILGVDGVVWHDKNDTDRFSDKDDDSVTEAPVWTPGVIAEQVLDAGLGVFVTYDEDGQPNGVMYDRLIAAVIPALRNLNDRIDVLEAVAA